MQKCSLHYNHQKFQIFLPEFENAAFERVPKDARRSREKYQSNLRQLFNLNQSISSFIYHLFGEDARADDVLYRCKLKVGFDVFQYYVKLGARRQIFLNLLLVI